MVPVTNQRLMGQGPGSPSPGFLNSDSGYFPDSLGIVGIFFSLCLSCTLTEKERIVSMQKGRLFELRATGGNCQGRLESKIQSGRTVKDTCGVVNILSWPYPRKKLSPL